MYFNMYAENKKLALAAKCLKTHKAYRNAIYVFGHISDTLTCMVFTCLHRILMHFYTLCF